MEKQNFLKELQSLDTADKSAVQLYNEVSALAMQNLRADARNGRCAHYLSIEFLIGRVFYNNLLEMGVLEETAKILKKKGVDIRMFEEIEDAALGNGGLGRLAACYLDSGAALGLPLYGYGIRYRYGLFRQTFQNGFQKETPDDWQRFGDPWSVRREEDRISVHFADMDIEAVPYDMPVIGKRVNILRLYQAEGNEGAEKISGTLYPPDDSEEGKLLRIRQEYFLSAAAVGDIVRSYEQKHGDFFRFAEENSIQLNDTHPVFAIPELIRVLAKKGVSYVDALKIAARTFNYTNHTILPEALECWDARLVRKILPDIAGIMRALSDTQMRYHKKCGYTRAESESAAIYNARSNTLSMANTAVFLSEHVNGVAEIHSRIIRNELFAIEAEHSPEKFINVTNGVAQRRWLMLANAELSSLIDARIGKDWRQNFEKISDLNRFTSDAKTLSEFISVKREKKKQLFSRISEIEKVNVEGERILFAQVKRLHEYKRQLMTAFALLRLYFDLKEGKLPEFTPALFLFGAKSAPSYFRAKGIIKYINEILKKINSDRETRDKLMGVFVTEYNVSYAEKIVAAADVSLQVSTAGLEASGTGNMKFMMNGAVTLGTWDGANIEIVQRSGEKNNYVFGARVEEIERLREQGHDPAAFLRENPAWDRVVQTLVNGTFSDDGCGCFAELYRSLTEGAGWHKPDHYFIFRDLEEYYQALLRADRDYAHRECFAEKQLKNTANSAYFSSDRSVMEYAEKIWRIKRGE